MVKFDLDTAKHRLLQFAVLIATVVFVIKFVIYEVKSVVDFIQELK